MSGPSDSDKAAAAAATKAADEAAKGEGLTEAEAKLKRLKDREFESSIMGALARVGEMDAMGMNAAFQEDPEQTIQRMQDIQDPETLTASIEEYSALVEEHGALDAATAGAEAVKKSLRMNEQCALLQNPKVFETPSSIKEKWTSFIHEDDSNTSHHNILSRIAQRNALGLMNITPAQYAALQPELRLWKIFHPDDKSKGEPKEFPFPKFTQIEEDADPLTGKTRGTGVGVKKFEFEMLGKNPATADNFIKAKLVLFFQNMSSLIEPIKIEDADGTKEMKYLDLVLRSTAASGSEIKAKTLQLLRDDGKLSSAQANSEFAKLQTALDQAKLPPLPFGMSDSLPTTDNVAEELAARLWNPRYFKIRADIGWSPPPGHLANQIEGFDESLIKDITNSKVSLFMSLLRHDFTFNQDGTIELTAEYVGMIETALASPSADILSSHSSANIQLRTDQARKSLLQSQIASANSGTSKRKLQQDLKNITQRVTATLLEDRTTQYPKIFNWLFNNGQIFEMTVPKAALMAKDLEQDTSGGTIEGSVYAPHIVAARAGMHEWQGTEITNMPTSGESKTLQNEIVEELEKKAAKESSVPGSDSMLASLAEVDDRGLVSIKFVYFGSILQAALDTIKADGKYLDPDLEKIKIRTGPVSIQDLNRIGDDSGVVNMANIPITLSAFKQFFTDKITRSQRRSYTLIKFLKDIVSELVVGSVGNKCIEEGAGLSSLALKPSITLFDVCPGNDRCTAGIDIEHNLYIYASQNPLKGLQGNEARDASNGIYHFYIGASGGLLKEITFSKTNVPHLSEARIIDSGEAAWGQLMEKYNAKLTLIGNALFKPGMVLYINPTLAGMGSAKTAGDLARSIGLGGYYDVIKVRSNINPESGFETEVEASWTAYPAAGTYGGSF